MKKIVKIVKAYALIATIISIQTTYSDLDDYATAFVQGPILASQFLGEVPPCGPNCLDLTGKIALIVGGSKGIGLAAASSLAAAGCQVITTSRHPQDYTGQPYLSSTCLDVRSDSSVTNFFNTVIDPLGRVDILVITAGLPFYGSIFNVSGDDMADFFQTAVFGYQRVIQATLPFLTAQNSRVIVMSSVAGNFPFTAVYTQAKIALQALIEDYTVEKEVNATLGVTITPATFTFLAPVYVQTTFGENEWCYPASVGRCDPSVLLPRTINLLEDAVGIPVADVGEAIYNIAASPNPNPGYVISIPSQIFGDRGLAQNLSQAQTFPIAIALSQLATVVVDIIESLTSLIPCQPLVPFTPCATGIETCSGV